MRGTWAVVAGVRFLAELGALAAAILAGIRLLPGPVGWVIGLGLAAALGSAWGRWVGPRGPHRLGDPARLCAELAIVAIAAGALALSGSPGWAVALMAAEAVTAPLARRAPFAM